MGRGLGGVGVVEGGGESSMWEGGGGVEVGVGDVLPVLTAPS